MEMCFRVLEESSKSSFDSYRRQEQCIDHMHIPYYHIPYYLSGLSRAHFSDNLSRNSCIHLLAVVLSLKIAKRKNEIERSQTELIRHILINHCRLHSLATYANLCLLQRLLKTLMTLIEQKVLPILAFFGLVLVSNLRLFSPRISMNYFTILFLSKKLYCAPRRCLETWDCRLGQLYHHINRLYSSRLPNLVKLVMKNWPTSPHDLVGFKVQRDFHITSQVIWK